VEALKRNLNLKKSFVFLPVALAVVASVLGVYWFQGEPRKAEVIEAVAPASGFSRALATGPLAGFIVHAARKDIAPFKFMDATSQEVDLSKWKGRVVLLNLWATWCAPCRKEMPDLAKLQTTLGGPEFEVVALSVDRKGLEASQAFLKELGVTNLAGYSDADATSLAALQALGLPATVLIDRTGKEAGRLLGPADWASPEAQKMVKALLAEK
jgi:thiol-disulfide isomerase/thioredoxin